MRPTRRTAALLWASLGVATGCPDPMPGMSPETVRQSPQFQLPKDKAESRFMRIRSLLSDATPPAVRAKQLYPLVEPVCREDAARAGFVDTLEWSVSFSTKENMLPSTLAEDVVEHVATSCFRNYRDGALDLLARVETKLPESLRIPVVRARLLATADRLDEAEAAAKDAIARGSRHAIALRAKIQAERARAQGAGYRPGMFDDALETVSVEPDGSWLGIDLNAVLSTRARLLTERALWENGAEEAKTRLEAASAYQRLSVPPFVASVRHRSLDVLCFEAAAAESDPHGACPRALVEAKNLGAAALLGALDTPGLDVSRRGALAEVRTRVEALGPDDTVALITRGDESELVEWAHATSILLRTLREPRLVWVDRTDDLRATRLVERVLARAGVEPVLRIEARKDAVTMPCVTALVARRKAPPSCPFEPAKHKEIRALGPFALSFLVGRDLDAEIGDLRLYELPAVLMSFRLSREEGALAGWMKSLTDVWMVAPGPTLASSSSP